MKKIKIAYIIKDLTLNGISTVVMNYCKNLNKDFFSIFIISGLPIESTYRDECLEKGINIVEVPLKTKNPFKYYRTLWKELSKNKFDIIHVHGNSATIIIELIIAKLRGVNIRIAHSHNVLCNHVLIHNILKPFLNLTYTHAFACSSLAGKWMFGEKKFYIIPNGFNIEKFKFNYNNRYKIRKELNIPNDAYLIGNIGKFNNQKNQLFLLKIFEKIASINKKSYLLLVGNGPNYQLIKDYVDNSKYKNKIILYGETSSPEKLYSAMDVFVFPSIFEGLGIVLLEAQISGLPCITSDVIPQEAILTNEFKTLSLNANLQIWVKSILAYETTIKKDRLETYNTNSDKFKKYDILIDTLKIEKIYKKIVIK